MQNYLTSADLLGTDTVSLIGDEYFHATRACRARVGDVIGVSDGLGRRVEARIERIDHTILEARIERDLSGTGEPASPITLALSLIKPTRFEIAVEKCTELGVRRIIPVTAKRCEQESRRLNPDRLQRIATEAAKQSGRSRIPELDPASDLAAVCEKGALLLSARQDAERAILPGLVQTAPASGVILLIGPEGDFTPEEHEYLAEKGAVPVTLGGLILRAETAAIAGVALIVTALR
jgi:16S rRNA (uracil1498-N3)-methyltransferase